MSLQIKIVLISFMVSVLTALIILPILKRLKVRPNRKRMWTTYTPSKTRNSYNGRNSNWDNTNYFKHNFI